MKQIFLNILLFITSYSFSQTAIKNTSLVNKDSSVLFLNSENVLQVSGSAENISVISKAGNEINSYYGKNKFVIRPKVFKNDTLIVLSDKKIILKKIFAIDSTGDPIVRLGNIKKDTVSLGEVLANRRLIVKCSNTLYNFPITVFWFKITCVKPNGFVACSDVKARGNIISPEQETCIRTLTPKSKITFEEIAVGGPDSRIRELPGFTLIIK
jgi:hypothetical protein